jgi:hypothetical protein
MIRREMSELTLTEEEKVLEEVVEPEPIMLPSYSIGFYDDAGDLDMEIVTPVPHSFTITFNNSRYISGINIEGTFIEKDANRNAGT